MWISRVRFEKLLAAETRLVAVEEELRRSLDRVVAAEERADRAVDAALISRHVPPITPPKVVDNSEQPGMFDDHPKQLAEMMREFSENPVKVLFDVGSGSQQG